MTRYLFTLIYFRASPMEDKKMVQFEEHIVAETRQQALEYWEIEFKDQGVEIQSIKQQVPVIAVLPQDKRK